MADTNDVMTQATHLGQLIGAHPAVQQYRELTRQLDLDITARNLVGQFEQLMETLSMKEQNMQPIEIAEKQQAERLQQSIALHPLLKKMMIAQAEYMDLMKKVQEHINQGVSKPAVEAAPGAAPAAPSKIILD